ncbi:EF-hand domain-containing protein [Jannaschia formosa]|uniref:EF-hand domain-containing protein n=1 Tax=Jannaschia formosa TaxID=2259592 RepID=UPI00142F84DF|nr:hypothetical protein [Jannaschia formosa]
MNTLTRSLVLTALLAGGGAMLAHAQGAPDPVPGAEAAQSARPMPAHFRGERGEHGGHHRRGGGFGQFGPMDGMQLFEEIDADGDGAVTQAEIDAFLDTQLEGADGDGDGALTLEEFAPIFFERMRPRMVDAFQRLDEDGSGTITGEEIDDRFGRMVERMDRDGDDALSPQDGRRGGN